MQEHYDTERALQEQIESVLAASDPAIDVRDVELNSPRATVRVFIAHPDGVSLDLCTQVTHLIHDVCARYALEVSSPGIEPALRRPDHFRDAIGSNIAIRRRGAKSTVRGTVTDVSDAGVTIERSGGAAETIALHDIARSHLVTQPTFTSTSKSRPRKEVSQ